LIRGPGRGRGRARWRRWESRYCATPGGPRVPARPGRGDVARRSSGGCAAWCGPLSLVVNPRRGETTGAMIPADVDDEWRPAVSRLGGVRRLAPGARSRVECKPSDSHQVPNRCFITPAERETSKGVRGAPKGALSSSSGRQPRVRRKKIREPRGGDIAVGRARHDVAPAGLPESKRGGASPVIPGLTPRPLRSRPIRGSIPSRTPSRPTASPLAPERTVGHPRRGSSAPESQVVKGQHDGKSGRVGQGPRGMNRRSPRRSRWGRFKPDRDMTGLLRPCNGVISRALKELQGGTS
jgi:hypothetical protein